MMEAAAKKEKLRMCAAAYTRLLDMIGEKTAASVVDNRLARFAHTPVYPAGRESGTVRGGAFMSLEIEVKRPLQLDDGRHTGVIRSVKERKEPFHYVDIYIEVDNMDGARIKYGAPANLSPNTKLGKLLAQFTELRFGEKLDVERALLDQRVAFVSVNEATDRGTFARIADGSVKKLGGAAAPAKLPAPEFPTEEYL